MADTGESTIIGADTKIKGELTFERLARVAGTIEGKITTAGELQIVAGGRCTAEIDAMKVVIDGTVKGNVRATDHIQLNGKASLKGDIVSSKLVVAEGATLTGHVSVGPDAVKNAPRPGAGTVESKPEVGKPVVGKPEASKPAVR